MVGCLEYFKFNTNTKLWITYRMALMRFHSSFKHQIHLSETVAFLLEILNRHSENSKTVRNWHVMSSILLIIAVVFPSVKGIQTTPVLFLK